jgi:amino acid transporter
MSFASVRRLLVGEPLPTAHAIHQRLAKVLALPVFASDAISSSAYAVEEILIVLVAAGAVGVHYAIGVALAITLLFAVVTISYRQTVLAYPSGGGAYIVAHENLGTIPGLVAAAALLTDYVLTVAVSIAAGVAAITSALPALLPYHVEICVLCIAAIALANLRGAKESGKLFAPPVYLFIGTVLLMVVVGLFRLLVHGASGVVAPMPPVVQGVTLFLLLRAFSSGCAALTGIEAISNGVPAFRKPEARNASLTLLWMAGICITIFAGTTVLAQGLHLLPDPHGEQTVFSMMGHAIFGNGLLYLLLQASTAAILILAANTSFADFPRLSSILARDGFAPRQLANLGDRLVFANGIIVLGLCSALLIVLFQGRTHLLIPLYAVGVFISFTLSQAGMVRHWFAQRGQGWRLKAAVNALGAVATAVVLMVVGSMKFLQGAWIVLLFVPVLMLLFTRIARHYRGMKRVLEMAPESRVPPGPLRHVVVVVATEVDRELLPALAYAQTIAPEAEAVHVAFGAEQAAAVREQWHRLHTDLPLTVLDSPTRSLVSAVLQYLRRLRTEEHADLVTVIVPVLAPPRWWPRLLRDQPSLLLRSALSHEPGVAVAEVPYRIDEEVRTPARAGR